MWMLVSWVGHSNPPNLFITAGVTLQILVTFFFHKTTKNTLSSSLWVLCVYDESRSKPTHCYRGQEMVDFLLRDIRDSHCCSAVSWTLSSIIYTLLSPSPLSPSPLALPSCLSVYSEPGENRNKTGEHSVLCKHNAHTHLFFSMMMGTFHWLLLFL